MHELFLDSSILRCIVCFKVDHIDWLLVLSHTLAMLQSLLSAFRVLIRDPVQEVADAKIEKWITFVDYALSLSQLLGPVANRRMTVIYKRDKFPEGRV